MRRVALFVATTSGPVRIERITRERAPQSVVCLRRTSTVLPISAAYDNFVRPGSGVVERAFGPFEAGAFRLDVSAPIDDGESWQLGFVVAHAVAANAGFIDLGTAEAADTILWLTGAVDHDLNVGPVEHLGEKLHASADALAAWRAAGKTVILVLPDASEDELATAALPDGIGIGRVTSVREALAMIGLALPSAALPVPTPLPVPRARPAVPHALAVGCALLVLAGLLLAGRLMPAAVVPLRTAEVRPPTMAAPAAVPPPALRQASLALVERRAPDGHTCADVQFGRVAALETPVQAGAGEGTSRLQDLCGLGLVVDNGGQTQFSAVVLEVLSGALLYGTERPRLLAGATAFAGRQEWPIDLPRRLQGPFALRATIVSAPHPTAQAAQALQASADLDAVAGDLGSDGIAVATLRHRVLP